jgi:hypothetical protein
MSTALSKEKFSGGLRKVSKATATLDRRVQHIRQLFSERIARAESEYHDALRRAVAAEYETTETTDEAPVVTGPVAV